LQIGSLKFSGPRCQDGETIVVEWQRLAGSRVTEPEMMEVQAFHVLAVGAEGVDITVA
jgi:hypothetical protein